MTNFPYNMGIPNPPDNPSQDVPKMKVNTDSTANLINVDHVGFGLNNGGTHRQVTLTNEAAPAIPPGTNSAFFANAFRGDSWPFFKNGSLTGLVMGPGSQAFNGYGFLSLGLLLQWGFVNQVLSNGDTGTVTFATSNVAFPNFCFTVFTTPYYTTAGTNPDGAASISINDTTKSSTKFDWTFNSNSSKYKGFYWVAIGN